MDTTVTIFDRELAEDTHLEAALKLVVRHQHVSNARVFCTPRTPTGWIEYIVQLQYATGGGMTIGVIQRAPGEAIECHS